MRPRPSGWTITTLVLVTLIVLPLGLIFTYLFGPAGETWHHLARTVLPQYVSNTLILLIGTGMLALVLGVSTAWVVSTYDFPFRRVFEWALALPLALPTYIVAYTYVGLFDYTGPTQRFFRALGLDFTIDVMNRTGLVILLALVLYPYVYLITRALFVQMSQSALEAARTLGQTPWRTFWRVALPMARPAMVGGSFLVMMEVLNDYGAAQYFGISTFTTGIFRAWFALGDLPAAIRLAAMLLVLTVLLLSLERWQRGRRRYAETGTFRPASRISLSSRQRVFAIGWCLIPVGFGFLLPVAQLLYWFSQTAGQTLNTSFLRLMANSFGVALGAGVLCVLVALVLQYSVRLHHTNRLHGFTKLAAIGYAIPGAVIAVGVLVPALAAQRTVNGWLESVWGTSGGLFLTGTLVLLIFAYLIRFLAIAFNPIEAGFERVGPNLEAASRTLGAPPLETLRRISVPLLRPALASATLLVFIEVLKELPLTLILRPFNFHTLATRAFELASDELVAESATPALLVIATGLVPVLLLNQWMTRR